MTYEPTREEVNLIRYLLDDVGGGQFWTDVEIIETLKQTKIFQYLATMKILKIKDGEEIKVPEIKLSELKEIRNLLDKILADKNPVGIPGTAGF